MAWLHNVAEELQRENVADLCLAYARAQDWIDGVVIGMETSEQLDANIALAGMRPLHPDECRYVEATRPRVPETLLDPAQWPPRA
jgi:aryl-alcohol dehydrogenase-like predicted oxidoreductase